MQELKIYSFGKLTSRLKIYKTLLNFAPKKEKRCFRQPSLSVKYSRLRRNIKGGGRERVGERERERERGQTDNQVVGGGGADE